ncbi:hypothetical protein F1C16_02910 [Hymenobacter sp. NBH84]|uniref:hypothetical protein n=1 Tax=Hymenobacter sp. NBH84 TaxID=2596915 RepID=UPI0016279D92|nr:hypothetical protein [Hymenobacter sp. NBH84]QNE38573.1 hypothetical protein F1C16_02910 [Hymenobacter sp. NBH84]
MQKHPNDGSNDNPDEFSEFRKPHENQDVFNLKEGEEVAEQPLQPNPQAAQPNAGTPGYGDFGKQPHTTTSGTEHKPAGTNPGGAAAPDTVDPLQRGGVAQNQDPSGVAKAMGDDAQEDESRTSWADDDPRYGSGTRNWHTNEPGNPTTVGPDPNEDNL